MQSFLNNSLFALGSAHKWQHFPSKRKVCNVLQKLCCVQNQRTVDYPNNSVYGVIKTLAYLKVKGNSRNCNQFAEALIIQD